MKQFLYNRTLAALALIVGMTTAGYSAAHSENPKLLVLTKYSISFDTQEGIIDRFLENALIPAFERLGHGPVGAFGTMEDAEERAIYTLSQHDSFEEIESLSAELVADAEFMANADEYLNRPDKANAAYDRIERRLLKGFAEMPAIKKPESGERIFELRDYESFGEMTAYLKVEMFNVAELDIFENVGLNSVFFGQTLFGPNQPNLVYMLVYPDMEEREAAWKRFLESPDWEELKQEERYKGTVSKIHQTFLKPKPYSQL